VGWFVAWAFWLYWTHQFHPTFVLALIVTTSLIVAFAAASYCNHLIFVPWFLALHKPWQYVCWLAATMVLFTGIALAIIRVSYFRIHGPDTDPYGTYKHFAIDMFGMIVHVALAAFIVLLARRLVGISGRRAFELEPSGKRETPESTGR
jgi:hypothetical protein